MPITVSLGKHYEDFLEEKLQLGGYEGVSEIIRAALCLFEEHERMLETQERELDELLEAGLNSEDAGEHEGVMARVLTRFKARRAARGTPRA